MTPIRLLTLCAALISLTACQKMLGAVDSIENSVRSIGSPRIVREEQNKAILSHTCPQINIVHDLGSITEFDTENSSKDTNIISSAKLTLNNSHCETTRDEIIIDLTLDFNSKLGPKAKIKSNDKPFFAYPFFVAVTDTEEHVLAKEVFAASMTYDRNQTSHIYQEQIRQIIPIERRERPADYKIYVGFQLDDQQLTYNRKTMAPPAPVIGAEPDAPPANAPQPLTPQQ